MYQSIELDNAQNYESFLLWAKFFLQDIDELERYLIQPKEAFENLLSYLPKDIDHKIIIFGCGGDRDKTKRTKMAKIASKYTDIQIITDDNPRNENPSDIRRILVESSSNPLEIPSRKKAIEKGVKLLKTKKGLLIIAGKGHENIQIYKDKNLTFNDRLVAQSYAKYL